MGTRIEGNLLKQLRSEAAKWVRERLPEHISAVGVDGGEVRRQLEIEGGNWVKYNLYQRTRGKEGTPFPDFLLEKEGILDPALRYPRSV